MLDLVILLVLPPIGGALIHRLWVNRPRARTYGGTAVGQVPVSLRRRRTMAVRVGGAA